MQNQRLGLNTQISTTVDQVNSYLTRIDDLNNQISTARALSLIHIYPQAKTAAQGV